MSRSVAYPFLTLSDEAVMVTPWLVTVDTAPPVPAGDFLADWDYSSPIRVERTISLDSGLAAADLNIPTTDLSLAVGLRIGTGRGRLPRAIILREYCEFKEGENSITVQAQVQ